MSFITKKINANIGKIGEYVLLGSTMVATTIFFYNRLPSYKELDTTLDWDTDDEDIHFDNYEEVKTTILTPIDSQDAQ